MRFAAPEWLWLLALIPLVALGGWGVYAGRRKALRRFAGGEAHVDRFTGQVSPHRRAIKLLLVYLALGGLAVALARPQWGRRLEPITRAGADVVIVLDASASMSAEDLPPSRLEQAKHAISGLLDRLAGDRVALVTFAGQAHVSCPLTVDHGALRLFLESIDVEAVPVPGTALAEALATGLDSLRIKEREADERGRAIVLFSDGEDHAGGLEPVLDAMDQYGIAVYTVGCGTTRGAPIPLRDPAGLLSGYKKDPEDRIVTTRLDEQVLERIALDTGGRYYRATTSGVEVEEIGQSLSALSEGELGSEVRTRYEERFQIPLLVAWLALAVETVLGDRRRERPAAGRSGEVS